MKQLYKYILTLIALSTATSSVWAEDCTYVLDTSVTIKYESNDKNENGTYVDISLSGVGAILSFSYDLSGSINATYWHGLTIKGWNGVNWDTQLYQNTDIKNKDSKSVSNITVPSNITKIRLIRTAKKGVTAGTRDLNVTDIKITRAKIISTSPTTFTFDPIPVGTTATKKVTINYSNIGTSVYASACDPADVATHFALTSAENLDCAGSVELTLTYQPQSEGNHGGTATISGSNGTSCTITVNGSAYSIVNPTHTWNTNTTFKVDDPNIDLGNKWISNNSEGKITYSIESFTPSGENNDGATTPTINGSKLSLGQAGTLVLKLHQASSHGFNEWTSKQTIVINKYDVDASISQTTASRNEIIDNPFSLSYGLTDFEVESKNTNIAEYHESTKQIQTYFTDGTASFQVTRPEDYRYKKLNKTLTLNINPNTNTCNVLEPCSGSFECSLLGEDRDFTPAAFIGTPNQLIFEASSNDGTRVGDVDVQQKVNGTWQTIASIDPGTSFNTYTYDLNPTATQIRFFNGYGSYVRYFKNVRVTRKTFLEPQIDGETFYLTQVSSGMQFAGTFPLAWSTCSENIRFSCDNPNFTILPAVIDASNGQDTTSIVITYSADTENPDLTGTLTIYDQSQTKTITLSCEHLLQTIEWPQYFYNLEADESGNINEDIELNAIAKSVNGYPTNQPITYTLNVSPANASLSTDANGNTHLNITGICEGTITASVSGFTDSNGRTYSASSLTREIRIRKAGDPCNSYALSIVNEQSTHGWGTNYLVFPISGLPESTMTFGAHADVGSINNYLYIDFHTDANAAPDAAGWSNRQTIEVKADDKQTWGYTCTVPADAKQVRFETVSSLNTYFDMVTIYQKEYLTADVERIDLPNTTVNQQFSASFTVDYSDVPFIQYQVTNSNNLNLQLTPSPEINNNCGEHGTYAFTLTGMSPYPQENVQETITIFTSAGHHVEIPVIITSRLSDTYYFNQIDGDWNNLENWRVNNAVPTHLPTPSNPVIISKAASIGTNDTPFEGTAYSIDIQQGGSITVLPKGGLTVHAGGFTGANENNTTIHNTKEGVGFLRISRYFTKEVSGIMPQVKVLYQTRSTLDTGANKDATWQYIGAPGANTNFTVDHITWLYHWSETGGWINKTGAITLQPFAGYAITQYGQPTYELTTTPIITNQTITLTKTEGNGGMNGDNLFANSFTSPIDAKNFTDEDFTDNVEKTFYIFNSGSWNQWNENQNAYGTNGTNTPGQYFAIPALSSKYLDSLYDVTTIPPMQGVYIIAKEDNESITLNYDKHVWHAGSNTTNTNMNEPMRTPQYTTDNDTNDLFMRLRIQVSSANSGSDRMYIIQDTTATMNYDNGYDAPNQIGEGLANIYTNEPFGKMEVSCSNNIDSMYIGFTAGQDSIYTLTFNSLIGNPIYLQDLENDSIIQLTEGGKYVFQTIPQQANDLRFQVLLHPELPNHNQGSNDQGTTSDLTHTNNATIWAHGKTIYIANVPANSIATLYNISGQALITNTIPHTPYALNLSHMPKGVYILRINNHAYKFISE